MLALTGLSLSIEAQTITSGFCGASGNNLTWVLEKVGSDTVLTISGSGAMADFGVPNNALAIPTPPWRDTIVGIWHKSLSMIKMVVIGNSVTTIGDYAFHEHSGMTTVTIGNNVASIGRGTFESCVKLTSLSLPNSVTTIADWAFSGCFSLSAITIPNSVAHIGNSAFSYCKAATSVTIGEGVTSMEYGAFRKCDNLQTVNFNAINCTKMEALVFSDDIAFDTLVVGNQVKNIPDDAFSYCGSLTSVSIGSGVITIGDSAFRSCHSLTSITVPNSVVSIGNFAFSGCGLVYVNVGNGVRSIGNNAFSVCYSLTTVALKDNLDSIAASTFSNCISLSQIIVPKTVTKIGRNAFSDCGSLISINIPNSVLSIEEHAFRGCKGLTAFNVESGNPKYSSIDGILYNKTQDVLLLCPEGKPGTVDIPNTVITIEYEAFFHCAELYSINIPQTVVNIGRRAFSYCDILTSIDVNINNPRYSSANGLLYSKMKDTLIQCPIRKVDIMWAGTVELPNSLTAIGNDAFLASIFMEYLIIPSGVTSIGEDAIRTCTSLASLTVCNPVPPALGNSDVFFPKIEKMPNMPIYIPCGSTSAYQAAFGWSDFTNFQDTVALKSPDNVAVVQQNNTLLISWWNTGLKDYEVYRDGILLKTVSENSSIKTCTYIDSNNLIDGKKYCYKVRAINENCESKFSGEVCQTFTNVGIEQLEITNFQLRVYPNPAGNQLQITNYELKENSVIEIYNVVGQKLLSFPSLSSPETTIDISDLAKGIYFLKAGNKTVRFMKE